MGLSLVAVPPLSGLSLYTVRLSALKWPFALEEYTEFVIASDAMASAEIKIVIKASTLVLVNTLV